MRSRTLSRLAATLIAVFLVIQIPMASVNAGISDTEGVGGFVARVYRTVMEREYDQEGFDFWTKGLINRELDAAKLMDCFVFSPEFQGYNISDEDYVRILYNSMMDREPDESGKAYWLDSLNRGMTRRRALSCFIDSQEFSDICSGYGVTRGTLPLTENVDIHTDKVMFVTGIYRNILGRDPDTEGLKNWTDYIVNGNNASDLILGFINSTEFKNRGLSDSEYIACLYRACLGREGGDSEISSWVDYMDSHLVSRKYVFAQILGSQECSNLCRNYGIVAGNVALSENRDKCVPVNDFVINAFDSGLLEILNFFRGMLVKDVGKFSVIVHFCLVHLHRLLRVDVWLEHVNLRDEVVGQLVRELLDGLHLARLYQFAILLLQLLHGGGTGTTGTLVRRHANAADVAQLLERLQHDDHHDGGAVRVGNDAAWALAGILSVALGHHEGHIVVHAESTRIVDHHAAVAGDVVSILT